MEHILNFFEKYGMTILIAIIILIVGYIITKVVIAILKRAFKRSTKLDPLCHKFILSLIKIVLYAVFSMMALSKLGVDMSSIIALFSVAGLAASLAVKDSLSNVSGGFILMFAKPFSVGDYIEVAGLSGTVQQVSILQTKLLSPDNKAVFIPNGDLSAAKITNYSIEGKRRLDLIIPVSYSSDIETVKNILSDVIKSESRILSDNSPIIRLDNLGSSSLDFTVKVWVTVADYWDLKWDLTEKIKTALDKNKIEIPYNKLDINILK